MATPALLPRLGAVPVAAFYALYVRRGKLNHRSVRQSYGFLYAGYTSKYYYWEVVIALRKVFLAVVSVVIAPVGPIAQTVTGVVVVVVALVLHAAAKPYNMASARMYPSLIIVLLLSISFALTCRIFSINLKQVRWNYEHWVPVAFMH